MTLDPRGPEAPVAHGRPTVAMIPADDIVVLASGTLWQVAWELMMVGPFVSCGLLDGPVIRHVTASAMVRSAVQRGTPPTAPLVASDYPQLPVFAARMPLSDAAELVLDSGWELAVVMDDEPRVVTSRSLFRLLLLGGPEASARTGRP